ncbi:MAG: hypothetical protein E7022_00025 [Desulfovibrio desulfuricans]|nr:hypothetical protein [Desulfovibrio desulfuricans]
MMTDEELDSFEDACKAALDGMYGFSSKQYLELIAMIRQARAERDWLAHALSMQCPEHRGSQVWLNIAKEAVCKN